MKVTIAKKSCKMERSQENKGSAILCTPLIHMIDEAGEKYLYDWNLSQSLPADKNFRVGECLHLGDLDCRCLYRKLQGGAYKRMSDGLVVAFSKEDMSVSPTTPDEELSDAAYCAKNSILGIGCRGKYFIVQEMNPKI